MGSMMLLAVLSLAQDAGALIGKMRAADPDVAENARRDLLDLGPAALPAVRKAAGDEPEGELKARFENVAVRLEVREKAAGLARGWGERWYSITRESLKIGWARLKAGDGDGAIVLDDEAYVKSPDGGEATFTIRMVCRPNEFLTPRTISLEASGAAFEGAYAAKVRDGRLIVEGEGRKKALEVGPSFTADFAAVRVVTLLPEVKSYEMELLRLVKPELPSLGEMMFDGAESIEYAGRRTKTRRFRYADGEHADRYYWVDGEGRLLRIEAGDGVRLELTDEASAKDLD